jgi:hypothetical protein
MALRTVVQIEKDDGSRENHNFDWTEEEKWNIRTMGDFLVVESDRRTFSWKQKNVLLYVTEVV